VKIVFASAILGVVAYATWYVLDQALGRSLVAQLISVGGAITLGSVVYAGVVLALKVPEARQIVDLFSRRLRGSS
jgi:putative peptidoglycan lipid II flippase